MVQQNSATQASVVSDHETMTLKLPEQGAALNIRSSDIDDMHVGPNGSLVIVLKQEAGHKTFVIENFQALAQGGSHVALNDGTFIETKGLYARLEGQTQVSQNDKPLEMLEIERPQAGEMVTVTLGHGHNYKLPSLEGAHVVAKGGALVITFADNGILILSHFEDALQGHDASRIVLEGKIYDLAGLRQAFDLSSPADLAQNDMDKLAKQLAGVEPAAGPDGGGGLGGHGYGFQSAVTPTVLGIIPPIGPIGPTELQFGLPELARERFPLFDSPDAFPPSITVNNGLANAIQSPDAIVKEDGSVFVPIQATLDSHGSANQVLTVTVTGIDPSWTLTFTDGAYDPATGTWTITLPAGQNYNGGLTFTPPHDSDLDLSGLSATATSFDPSANESASSSTGFGIVTDAVADVPDLSVQNATVEEAKTVSLHIGTAVTDTDGSEVIAKVTIQGLPAGATLNHGTLSGGIWTLSPTDLADLKVTLPDHSHGVYDLTVKSYSEEVNLGGGEVDFSDNIAVATDTLRLTVTRDDEPVLTQPEKITVDETNLGPIVVHDKVEATVGADGPGVFAATGAFGASGSVLGGTLTSGGAAVVVTEAGGIYTGAANGQTVFTLKLESDGDYTFTLFKPLDHADGSNPNDSINLVFGVRVNDTDGDSASGSITVIVKDDGVTAHNDVNTFETDNGSAAGNVITGLNGGPGAADSLSHDTPNVVSKVMFGSTSVDVPASGTATIDGQFGTLTIKADGSYTYTLHSDWKSNVPGNSAQLAPVSSDLAGTQTSITKNGFTVTSVTGGDLVWTVRSDGTGIGVAGNGTDKIFKGGEGLNVDFAPADAVSIKIADIGASDLQSVIGLKVYVEGSATPVVHNIDVGAFTSVNGYITVTLNGADFGGQITKFEITSEFSAASGKYSSFMLADVTTVDNCGCGCPTDTFTYTLKDGDGDTGNATLSFACAPDDHPVVTPPATLSVDETALSGGDQTVSGTVVANYGADGPGTVTNTGTFSSSAPLTSGGTAVTVSQNGDTYTGTAGGTTVFTLVVHPDGSYTFTLKAPIDHPDATNPDDAINLNFGVKATDSDGDSTGATIVIRVLDDGPVAHNDVNAFDARIGHAETGNVITGLNGGAGAADVKSQDAPNAVAKISFGGVSVNVPSSGEATINGDHGTLKIKADGSYTYTLTDTGAGSHVTDTFTYTLKDGDGDTSTATLKLDGCVGDTTVTIVVKDPDGHVIANGGDTVVKEDHSTTIHVDVDGAGSGSQILTVTMTGIDPAWGFQSLNGGTYNAATGTWTATLAAGQDFNGAFKFTPPHDSDLDLSGLHIAATVNDAATGRTATATDTFNIVTDAVADAPNLSASGSTGEEGTSVALHINTSVTDTDGSETIQKVEISGLPAGATLNHGTVSGGVWTVSQADLADLRINIADGTHEGNYALTVKSYAHETNLGGTEVDFTDNTASKTVTLDLCVTKDDVPVVTDPAVRTVDESDLGGSGIAVSGHVNVDFGSDGGTVAGDNTFSSSVALTSGGVPVAVTQSGDTYTGKAGGATIFTLTVNPNGDYAFTLLGTLDHPNKMDANDAISLNFGVKATDGDGDTDTGHIVIKVLDDGPVAHNDFNTFTAAIGATDSGNVISGLNGGAGAADAVSKDQPNVVSKISFGGVSVNVPSSGEATINGDHGTLKIKADGSYTYTLTDTGAGSTVEDSFTYTLKDGDGDTSTACLTLKGAVCDVKVDLCVNNGADNVVVKEDGSVLVSVTADAAGSGAQVLTLVLTGINPAWGFQSLNGGTYNAATGTWTATLAAGQDFNGAFRFAPPHDSDLDLSGLRVTATVNDASIGRSASSSDTFNIVVDAVADAPNLSASGASGDEGSSIPLHIATSVTDTDGSETIQKVEIGGLPAGATLNHGTVSGGVWTVSQADLADLRINVPNGAEGSYALTVKSYARETNLGGAEVDFTDNVAVATTRLELCVNDDHAPVITDPAVKTVDETNLTGSGIAVNGQITVDFGNDGGTVAGNNTFSSSVALTSGGVPVAVTQSGNVYTGKAGADTVFTLTVNADGSYSFKLLDTLDHPNKADANDAITLTFGVKATDGDGDVDTGHVVVKVLDDGPVAHDDFNAFTATIGATDSGNVISGLNGGAGAADSLSKDTPNTVTKISFGATSVDVPSSGEATIHGDHGTLRIKADGSYTYTVTDTGSGSLVTDSFTYTLKDGDGDTDTACLTLKGTVCDVKVDLCVNNGVDNVRVKEDGSVLVHVTADGTGSGGQVITLVMTGIKVAWGFQSLNGGTYDAATGTWTKTLAAGADFDGSFRFTPPHDSDMDLNALKVTATVHDSAIGRTATAIDTFNVVTDAVADMPVLTVQGAQTYQWHKDYSHDVPLSIASHVTDTDGSEVITQIVIRLNNPFTNGAGGINTLDDMGVTLNKGTEVSPGVWVINVNNGDAASALNGLAMTVPAGHMDFWPIHQSQVGGHSASITVESHVLEKNLSGAEYDTSDNSVTAVKNIQLCFYVTPLAIDLDGNGVQLVNKDAGVMFDMNNNGTLDQTSWVGPHDGLLAIDANHDGVINNQSELLGNTAQHDDGFDNLRSLDGNGDGVIDAKDAAFTDLKVWQDVNQDGVSQSGELHALSDLGIAAIRLETTVVDRYTGDSWISEKTSFVYADGREGEIVDAWFSVTDGNEIGVGSTVTGTEGNDIVYGAEGKADVLYGNGGNDVLEGLGGNDTLYGGQGADVFRFLNLDGVSRIADFNVAEGDTLDLSGLLHNVDPLTAAIHQFVFTAESAGSTVVSVDLTGSGDAANATAVAVLDGVTGVKVEDLFQQAQQHQAAA